MIEMMQILAKAGFVGFLYLCTISFSIVGGGF